MAELFGVITGALGALDVGIGWFRELHQSVKAYRNAGERLQSVHDKFDQFEQRLDLWAKTWNVGVYGPTTDIQAIWGQKGALLVRQQLVAILKKCEDFNHIMARLTSPRVLAILQDQKLKNKQPTVIDNTLVNEESISESREIAALIQQVSRSKDKAKFTLFKAQELDDYVNELNKMYTLLDYDSKARWTDEHPEWSQLASSTTRMTLGGKELLFIPLALRTREASKALFKSCALVSVTTNTLPKFEMTLLQEDIQSSDSDEQTLRYHLLVPCPDLGKEVEMLIKGPLVGGCTSFLPDHKDFVGVCEAISHNETEMTEFKISMETALWFTSCPPLTPLQGIPTTFLADLLEKTSKMSAFDALEAFPSSERLELAYKAVECGLFFLGTPWLSDLSSKRLERVSIPFSPLFILGTGRLGGAKIALDMEETFQRIGQQIFALGVLLAEIGTGQPMSDNFLMNQNSIPDLLGRIPYGLKYSRAVEFCLLIHRRNPHIKNARRHGGDFKTAFTEVLQDYHAKVYLPIKGLMQFLSSE